MQITTKELQILLADLVDGTSIPVEIQSYNRPIDIIDVRVDTRKSITYTESGMPIPKTESKLIIWVDGPKIE